MKKKKFDWKIVNPVCVNEDGINCVYRSQFQLYHTEFFITEDCPVKVLTGR